MQDRNKFVVHRAASHISLAFRTQLTAFHCWHPQQTRSSRGQPKPACSRLPRNSRHAPSHLENLKFVYILWNCIYMESQYSILNALIEKLSIYEKNSKQNDMLNKHNRLSFFHVYHIFFLVYFINPFTFQKWHSLQMKFTYLRSYQIK